MQKIIEAKKLCKSYESDKDTLVLNGVNLTINEGDFVTIMGPSGSGKSTLLFSLSGMDDFQSGQVFFLGMELHKMNDNDLADLRRKEMGFVFQNPTMLKNLDILDNILLPSFHEASSRENIKEKAKNLMNQVGLSGLENRPISGVSGGQLQRAAICRAILHHPKILFGDEPTGALNSKSSQEIMDLFSTLNKDGMTILLVTHDAKVAAKSQRVLFMKDGKIETQLDLKGKSYDDSYNEVSKKMIDLSI